MYTHRGAAINALGEVIVHGLERDSVFLWTLPLFHCNGWCFPWAVTAAGGTHVMLRAIEPGRVIRLIQSERVTHFNGAPTVLIMLADGARGDRACASTRWSASRRAARRRRRRCSRAWRRWASA